VRITTSALTSAVLLCGSGVALGRDMADAIAAAAFIGTPAERKDLGPSVEADRLEAIDFHAERSGGIGRLGSQALQGSDGGAATPKPLVITVFAPPTPSHREVELPEGFANGTFAAVWHGYSLSSAVLPFPNPRRSLLGSQREH